MISYIQLITIALIYENNQRSVRLLVFAIPLLSGIEYE